MLSITKLSSDGLLGFDDSHRLSDPSDVFVICSSLINSISTSDAMSKDCFDEPLSLAHNSVKEYLYSKDIANGPCADFRVVEADAQCFVAKSCIAYLLALEDHNIRDVKGEMPLASYIAKYWADHAEIARTKADLAEMNLMICRLLRSRNAMLRMHQLKKPHYPSDFFKEKPALHWAAQYGFEDIASELASDRSGINEKDLAGRTGLHEAIRFRKYDVAGNFLELGIETNTLDIYGLTALHYAIFNDDLMAVSILLQCGADPNIYHKSGKPPLYAATERGNPSIVEILLKFQANANASFSEGQHLKGSPDGSNSGVASNAFGDNSVVLSCLQVAVWSGYKQVVRCC